MSALHTEHRGRFRWGCETVDDDNGVTIRTATAELPSGLVVERCDTSGGDGSDVTLVFVRGDAAKPGTHGGLGVDGLAGLHVPVTDNSHERGLLSLNVGPKARTRARQVGVSRRARGPANLHGTPNDVEAGTRTRMRRQQVLYDPAKRFRFLLTEAALHYRICPPSVHRGQLDRLLAASGMDTVTLAVIPFTATLPVVPSHAFTMFDDTLVLVEMIGAELAFKAADEKTLYVDVFERLWRVGVQDQDAAELITKAIETMSRRV